MAKDGFDINRMVKEIFKFLGAEHTVQKHKNDTIAEGEFGGKLLSMTYSSNNNKECGFQFRACDTHRSLGGALLRCCLGYKFETERKAVIKNGIDTGETEDYKIVKIFSLGGEIAITKDGIYSIIV